MKLVASQGLLLCLHAGEGGVQRDLHVRQAQRLNRAARGGGTDGLPEAATW